MTIHLGWQVIPLAILFTGFVVGLGFFLRAGKASGWDGFWDFLLSLGIWGASLLLGAGLMLGKLFL